MGVQDKPSDVGERLKARIKDAVGQATNVTAAINVGEGAHRTSVSTRQKVVHRDGATTITTERYDQKTTTSTGKEEAR